jgi:outer membrane receptor protein involved in Fe transport
VSAELCPSRTRQGLRGRYTLEAALKRLLEDSGCSFRLVDARTVQVFAPPRRAAHPAAAAPVASELLVTATKRRLSADEIAAAVSVLPQDQLAATRAVDVRRTTGQIAGVVMTNLGAGRDKLIVRGLSDGVFTGRARATVATYLDETALNYDAPDPDLRLTDVARVEVVRGPQGALYGDGALAGVYRIVTRKPDLADYAAGLEASYATTHGGAPSHSVDLYANLPLARDQAALRLVGYHEVQGGYLDDVLLRRTNVDRTARDGARGALRLAPAADWTVDLSSAWQSLTSSDTQYVIGPLSRRRANRVAEAHDNRFFQAGLTVRGSLGWADLTSSAGYVRHDFRSLYDATAALDIFSEPSFEVGVYEESRAVRMVSEDLVLSSSGRSRVSWLAGLYAAHSSEESPSELQALLPAGGFATLYSEARSDRLRTLAAYGEVSYAFAPGWAATFGGRAMNVRLRTDSAVIAAPPGRSRDLAATNSLAGFSPKLSVQHDLAAGGLVYALFSSGKRPGGFNSGGLLPLPPQRAWFAPDELRNYEVGAKLTAFGDRLSARFAAFYDEWRNLQTDRYLPSGLAYTANVGDAEIYGVEGEASHRFDGGLTLQANLLLTKARLTRRNPDFAANFASDLPGAPPFSGGVLALYQRRLVERLGLRLRAEASYIGHSHPTFDVLPMTPMGGYFDAELSAGLVGVGWSADIFVSNPGDSSADTFAYGNPFSFGRVRQATPQRPRSVGIDIVKEF